MKFIKQVLKWGTTAGALGAAYGFGVHNTTKKVSKKRRFGKGRK